jgi:hypothetical protein
MDARNAPELTTKILAVVGSLALLAAAVLLAMLATTAFVDGRNEVGLAFAVVALADFAASELLRRRRWTSLLPIACIATAIVAIARMV